MGFIGDILTTIINIPVTVLIYIVDVVVQIVETIIHLIKILLGWKPDSQTVEFFEVRNIPMFTNVKSTNSLLEIVINSVFNGTNLSSEIAYANIHRSIKGDFQEFMDFIDDGNYFESFPTVESFIIIIDYDELTTVLTTVAGAASTPVTSRIDSLNYADWIKSWLQDNKTYDVGANRLGADFRNESTSPITPAADGITVTPSANHWDLAITSEIATEDALDLEGRWFVDYGNITYNSGPDNYTIQVYNDLGGTDTLGYTVPSIPTGLHYISQYYIDSDPSREYIFIYLVGAGTYPDLDNVETPIDQSAVIQAVPAIPLRISNSNYTTFGATKAAQIVDLCWLVTLDADEILTEILSDPDADPGDIDNVYINFGIRMRDTSQAGMSYLFNMFENLYPTQAVTLGVYNTTAAGDDKPANNIILTTDDNKLIFQFSYITFEHTTLATLDAAGAGNTEYDVYYSDLTKFDSSNNLVYPYYSSSSKGAYSVGFFADTLQEVADFLSGSGRASTGFVSAEATNWLQVSTRLSYNNTTPVLQDPDGTTSALLFLTGDMVYENNGSGGLRIVNAAAVETTGDGDGQSVIYYYMDEDGIDAYKVCAPIASMKVIDGDTGVFRTVKFNLANEFDLMVPMFHTFIKGFSNKAVTELFLAGAHASIYIAHYEVIQPASMSFFLALVLLVIIAVLIYFGQAKLAQAIVAWQTAALIGAVVAVGLTAAQLLIIQIAVVNFVIQFAITYLVKLILVEVFSVSEEFALILGIAAAMYAGSLSVDSTELGSIGISFKDFSSLTGFDIAKIGILILNNINTIQETKLKSLEEELSSEIDEFKQDTAGVLEEINNRHRDLFIDNPTDASDLINRATRVTTQPMYAEAVHRLFDSQYEMPYLNWSYSEKIEVQISGEAMYI
jgi:hypothetical protein